jgi:hypothetical protein
MSGIADHSALDLHSSLGRGAAMPLLLLHGLIDLQDHLCLVQQLGLDLLADVLRHWDNA